MDDILKTLTEIYHEKLDGEETLSAEMRLAEDLHLDSLRLMTLAIEVEDRFRICLDEDDEGSIVTVGDLVAIVGEKIERTVDG
jgi:acyl carrier protein